MNLREYAASMHSYVILISIYFAWCWNRQKWHRQLNKGSGIDRNGMDKASEMDMKDIDKTRSNPTANMKQVSLGKTAE